jgi:transposase-like protein
VLDRANLLSKSSRNCVETLADTPTHRAIAHAGFFCWEAPHAEFGDTRRTSLVSETGCRGRPHGLVDAARRRYISTRNSEIMAKRPERRRFTAEYKRRILREADACTEPGQVSALLRREGLYSSHVVAWRRARERGELAALAPKKRGPKPKSSKPLSKELSARDKEIARLTAENERLHLVCEGQERRIAQLLLELSALVARGG